MARKKHPEEHENLERWLVSYADFITLLFAFFTVLYALSQTDKTRYQKALENIQRAFLSAGGVFPLRGSPFVPFEKPVDRGSAVPPSPAEQGPYSKADNDALEQVRAQVEGLYQRTTGLGLQKNDVEVIRTEEGFKIRLGEYVLFGPGSDKIRRESLPFLYEMGKRLVNVQGTVQVEGYTDSSSARGDNSNWHLSANRAFNMAKFLVEGVRFPQDRLSIAAYGEARPVASNATPEGRARNRRVEISILTKDTKAEKLLW
jgi:chemotaxis protein MotB